MTRLSSDLLPTLERARHRDLRIILLNLNEQGFRSFFNQYTDLHRSLFVSLVLDQLLLACPNTFILLYSTNSISLPDGAIDEVFQSYAFIWLHKHGHKNIRTLSSYTATEEQLPLLINSVDLVISPNESIVRTVSSTSCPLLVLMGVNKMYTNIDSLLTIIKKNQNHSCRVVSEIHAIASAVASIPSCNSVTTKWLDLGRLDRTTKHGFRDKLKRFIPFLNAIHTQTARPKADSVQHPLDYSQVADNAPILDINSAGLEVSLRSITDAYFNRIASEAALTTSDLSSVRFDGDPSFVPEMLERDSVHDADYLVFHGFTDPNTLILDIGANWGYSVSSIETSGAKSKIISFEALPTYRPCLAAVAELRPDKYHYFMTALSDCRSELTFTVPTVNNQALSALTTAAAQPDVEAIVSNVVSHIRQWMTDIQTFRYRLVSFRVPVQRLDDVFRDNTIAFGNLDIVAIKIDVEGMEFPVLCGAETLLKSHRPLIMAEDASSNAPLIKYLGNLGYVMAERHESQLRIVPTSTATGINGFFLHMDRLGQYKSMGILT